MQNDLMYQIFMCYSNMDTQGGQIHISSREIKKNEKKLEKLFLQIGRRVSRVEASNAMVGTKPQSKGGLVARVPLIKMPECPWDDVT